MGCVHKASPLCEGKACHGQGFGERQVPKKEHLCSRGESFKMVFPLHLFKNKKFLTQCQLCVRFHLSL